jgi:CBS-domain-containing membrane protein
MSQDGALPTFRIEPGTSIAQTQPRAAASVTLNSPALDVMTDLTLMRAATVHPSTLLPRAEQVMIYQGVRMLFVVTDMPSIEGLVTATDLLGDKAMQVVTQRNLRHDELSVGDVMTSLASLDAIEFERMGSTTVGQLVATLKHVGHHHLLVVEGATPTTPRRVRGVVSRAQIERQLGAPVDVTQIASSFSEIERALN